MHMSKLVRKVVRGKGNRMSLWSLRMILRAQFKERDAPHNAGDSVALIT
jgi:hypothetical protein